MRLILHYLKRYKGWFVLDFLSVFGFALAELGLPTMVAEMIDGGIMQGDPAAIWQAGRVCAVIAVVGVAGTVLLGFCCARLSTNITADIREEVFRKAQTFSHAEFGKFGIASMITRTNNDAFQIQLFLNALFRTALMTPVMMCASFILTLRASPRLSVIVIATFPLIVLGVVLVSKWSRPVSEQQQTSQDNMNRITRENLTGVRVVRAFNNDAREQARFEAENERYTKASRRMFKLMMMTQPVFFLVMNFAVCLIFWFGGHLLQLGQIEIGQLTAFMDYLFHAMFSILMFSMVFMIYPKAAVSARRIQAVLDTQPLVQDPKDGETLTGPVEEITFSHVSFTYPEGGGEILHDISLSVRRGETVAFVGSTGSGKSALVSLLPRFYDVTKGSVRVNGTDVRQFHLQSLRRAIGFVPQKAFLFSGTIADNIRFGKEDATDEEVVHAAQVAQAEDFIRAKPGGFAAPIAENAANVSGGQRQRLSIARALVRKPAVYVFDDSFSALDFQTDLNLRRALRKETGDAIVLIVAQRISTVMDADRIFVLDHGSIVGQGRHEELLDTCPVYREIAASQLNTAELAGGKGVLS